MARPGWLGRLLGWSRADGRPAHLKLGDKGELAAARFLKRAGCRVVARNLRTPGGEADIVCVDRRTGATVLVEVKTRVHASGSTISPTAAINAEKRRRLVGTARSLATLPRFAGKPIRIDVVTVEYRAADDRAPNIRHYLNAVTADGKLR
jgi:putative endonuclease